MKQLRGSVDFVKKGVSSVGLDNFKFRRPNW